MKRNAFTLIELLVVIAIIGLLSTIAVISLTTARAKAIDAKRLADIKQLITAMTLYYNDNNTLPRPAALSCTDGDTWYCLGQANGDTCWRGTYQGCNNLNSALTPYISKIPDDPRNNTTYNGDSYLYTYNAGAPILHWGIDEIANANLCLGGISGQWSAGDGNNRYWCMYYLRP
jgi:prepilin-type N-terminal cleavage/methylation domain-containing protein